MHVGARTGGTETWRGPAHKEGGRVSEFIAEASGSSTRTTSGVWMSTSVGDGVRTVFSADVAVELDPFGLVGRAGAWPRGRLELVVPDVLARVAGVYDRSFAVDSTAGRGGPKAQGDASVRCARARNERESKEASTWASSPGQAFSPMLSSHRTPCSVAWRGSTKGRATEQTTNDTTRNTGNSSSSQ